MQVSGTIELTDHEKDSPNGNPTLDAVVRNNSELEAGLNDFENELNFEQSSSSETVYPMIYEDTDDDESAYSATLPTEEAKHQLARELKLEHEWVFWFDEQRSLTKGMTGLQYEHAMNNLGKFSTIEGFWQYVNSIPNVTKLPYGTNLRFFKSGIKPLWEDPANEKGGKWTIKASKKYTQDMWSKLLLFVVGEQFEFSDDLCGAVLAIRDHGDTLYLWNRTGNEEIVKKTTEQLETLFQIKTIKYQLHNGAWGTFKVRSAEITPVPVQAKSPEIVLPVPSEEKPKKMSWGERSESEDENGRCISPIVNAPMFNGLQFSTTKYPANRDAYPRLRRLSIGESDGFKVPEVPRHKQHRKTFSLDLNYQDCNSYAKPNKSVPAFHSRNSQESPRRGNSVSPRTRVNNSPTSHERHPTTSSGRPIISPRNKDQPVGSISMGSPRRKIEPANLPTRSVAYRSDVPPSPRRDGKLRSQSVSVVPPSSSGHHRSRSISGGTEGLPSPRVSADKDPSTPRKTQTKLPPFEPKSQHIRDEVILIDRPLSARREAISMTSSFIPAYQLGDGHTASPRNSESQLTPRHTTIKVVDNEDDRNLRKYTKQISSDRVERKKVEVQQQTKEFGNYITYIFFALALISLMLLYYTSNAVIY